MGAGRMNTLPWAVVRAEIQFLRTSLEDSRREIQELQERLSCAEENTHANNTMIRALHADISRLKPARKEQSPPEEGRTEKHPVKALARDRELEERPKVDELVKKMRRMQNTIMPSIAAMAAQIAATSSVPSTVPEIRTMTSTEILDATASIVQDGHQRPNYTIRIGPIKRRKLTPLVLVQSLVRTLPNGELYSDLIQDASQDAIDPNFLNAMVWRREDAINIVDAWAEGGVPYEYAMVSMQFDG